MRKKGQISTEYLIVFGIAFLIIIAGVFAFMKFSKSGAMKQETCLIATGMQKCTGSSLKAGTGAVSVNLEIENVGDPIAVTSVTATIGSSVCATAIGTKDFPTTAPKQTINLDCVPDLTANTKVDADFVVKYKNVLSTDPTFATALEQTFTGHITGTVV